MEKFKIGRACVKCGMTGASAKYIRENIPRYTEEHLERTCDRCGYIWRELPLDCAKIGRVNEGK